MEAQRGNLPESQRGALGCQAKSVSPELLLPVDLALHSLPPGSLPPSSWGMLQRLVLNEGVNGHV